MEYYDIDKFLFMEEELYLFKKEIEGFHFWIYIRNYIYDNILTKKYNRGVSSEVTKIDFQKFIQLIKCFFRNDNNFYNFQPNDCQLLFMSHPRRTLVDGYFVSIYTDYYAKKLDHTLTIEPPYEGSHYQPVVVDNILYLDKFFVKRKIINKIKSLISYKSIHYDYVLGIMKLVSNRISQDFGVYIDPVIITNRVLLLLERYKYSKKYFKRMIFYLKPKAVIEIVYYSFENLVLNEVCREANIPIIELQHGLIGRYHEAYNFYNNSPMSQLPNFLFTFSSYWKENVRLPKDIIIRSTGFAYYNFSIQKFPKNVNGRDIIIISSGTSGKFLYKIAIDLTRLTDRNIIFKLHPSEFSSWKKRYPELIHSNVDVIDNNSKHLYQIFSNCEAQVGVYSTAVFEGLGYGLKTFIVNCEGLEHVKDLLLNNDALLVNNANEIIENFDTIAVPESSKYWGRDPFNTTMNEIKKVVNHGTEQSQ